MGWKTGWAGIAALLLTAGMVYADEGIKDVLTVIHNRKSVRTYADKPVTKAQLEILLRAGMAAPTAGDRRPWAFVVVTDKKTLTALDRKSVV